MQLSEETLNFLYKNSKIEMRTEENDGYRNRPIQSIPNMVYYYLKFKVLHEKENILKDLQNWINNPCKIDLIISCIDFKTKVYGAFPYTYSHEDYWFDFILSFDFYKKIDDSWQDWFLLDEDRKKYYASL